MLAREKKRAAILAADNTICPICKGSIHEAVYCPAIRQNVCIAHCASCRYNVKASPASNQSCMYRK